MELRVVNYYQNNLVQSDSGDMVFVKEYVRHELQYGYGNEWGYVTDWKPVPVVEENLNQ